MPYLPGRHDCRRGLAGGRTCQQQAEQRRQAAGASGGGRVHGGALGPQLRGLMGAFGTCMQGEEQVVRS